MLIGVFNVRFAHDCPVREHSHNVLLLIIDWIASEEFQVRIEHTFFCRLVHVCLRSPQQWATLRPLPSCCGYRFPDKSSWSQLNESEKKFNINSWLDTLILFIRWLITNIYGFTNLDSVVNLLNNNQNNIYDFFTEFYESIYCKWRSPKTFLTELRRSRRTSDIVINDSKTRITRFQKIPIRN